VSPALVIAASLPVMNAEPNAPAGMYSTYIDTRVRFFSDDLAKARPMSIDDLIPELLKAIDHLSKYTVPDELPAVHRVPHTKIAELACGRECAALGAYRSGEGIYLDEALRPETNIFARSVLLHELVHYVQDVANELGSAAECERWYRREQEAYAIQKRFLMLVGSEYRVAYSAAADCERDSG
jgi:hypothetical protein